MADARVARPPSRPIVTIHVDGQAVEAGDGETLATALLAAGHPAGRLPRSGAPRGPWCMIGICRQCVATVDGRPGIRTCRVAVRPGTRVDT